MTGPMVRVGGIEDLYRYVLHHFPPPEWVPVAKELSAASGTTNTKRKKRDMAVALVGEGKANVEARIAELEAQLADQEMKLAAFVPEEPTAPFAVIRFQKYSSVYTFAAIKVGARWFLTQDGTRSARQGHAPKVWPDLLDFIGNRNWRSIEVLS